MTADLPQFYFRIRENGATVFRVDTENRQRRIEMAEIATINVKNGNIKPHADGVLTAPELAVIKDWLATRVATLAAREIDDIHRAADHLNLTSHWAQTRATEAQLDEVTDTLLMAMHDLRTVLVRKKSERLTKDEGDGAA